jgi:hypothetical protein
MAMKAHDGKWTIAEQTEVVKRAILDHDSFIVRG